MSSPAGAQQAGCRGVCWRARRVGLAWGVLPRCASQGGKAETDGTGLTELLREAAWFVVPRPGQQEKEGHVAKQLACPIHCGSCKPPGHRLCASCPFANAGAEVWPWALQTPSVPMHRLVFRLPLQGPPGLPGPAPSAACRGSAELPSSAVTGFLSRSIS